MNKQIRDTKIFLDIIAHWKKNSKKKGRENFKNDLTLLFTNSGNLEVIFKCRLWEKKISNTMVLDLDGLRKRCESKFIWSPNKHANDLKKNDNYRLYSQL